MKPEERLARNAQRLRDITGGLFEAAEDPLLTKVTIAHRVFVKAIANGCEEEIDGAFWAYLDALADAAMPQAVCS